jgi:hypothetical protein
MIKLTIMSGVQQINEQRRRDVYENVYEMKVHLLSYKIAMIHKTIAIKHHLVLEG